MLNSFELLSLANKGVSSFTYSVSHLDIIFDRRPFIIGFSWQYLNCSHISKSTGKKMSVVENILIPSGCSIKKTFCSYTHSISVTGCFWMSVTPMPCLAVPSSHHMGYKDTQRGKSPSDRLTNSSQLSALLSLSLYCIPHHWTQIIFLQFWSGLVIAEVPALHLQNASVGIKGSVAALFCSSMCVWDEERVLP